MSRFHRAAAEGIATAFLLAAVVGSGIMGERLADGNIAIALLANSIATAGALIALILAAGPVSGAHMNPAVTLLAAWQRSLAWGDVPWYVGAQVGGAMVGVFAAHAMFDLPLLQASEKIRSSPSLVFSEYVATLGLLLVVARLGRARSDAAPYAVAGYILAAYWFTASTSFANPAVTIARCLSNTFAGIRPDDIGGFILGQLAAVATVGVLFRQRAIENGQSEIAQP